MRVSTRQLLFFGLIVASGLGAYAASQAGDDFHLRTNIVFKELTEKGVQAADMKALKLPAPMMADGLDKAAQIGRAHV